MDFHDNTSNKRDRARWTVFGTVTVAQEARQMDASDFADELCAQPARQPAPFSGRQDLPICGALAHEGTHNAEARIVPRGCVVPMSHLDLPLENVDSLDYWAEPATLNACR
jgi:hypothetical protein